MADSWYSGKFLIGRIIITIICVLIIIWTLLICFIELRLKLYRMYHCFRSGFYKTASIVPVEEATITTDPITSYAKEIPLNTEIIIL